MSLRYMILPLLLALLTAGLSLGQPAGSTSIADDNSSIEAVVDQSATLSWNESTPINESINESTPINESLSLNETGNVSSAAGNAIAAPLKADLNYIWSFSGIEAGLITMALEQNGSVILGRAKYEPDDGMAWNADVLGSVEGDKVELTMSAMKDNALTTTRLSGTFANEAIRGNFTQVRDGKIVANGTFNATWINPDISSYTPAKVEAPAAVTAPAPAEVTSTADTADAAVNKTTSKMNEKKYTDVREFKDKIGMGGDLSGIPPGMSGF